MREYEERLEMAVKYKAYSQFLNAIERLEIEWSRSCKKSIEEQYLKVAEFIVYLDKCPNMFSYGIFLADALSSETANLILDYGKIDFSTLNSY